MTFQKKHFIEIKQGTIFKYKDEMYIKCQEGSIPRTIKTKDNIFTMPPQDINSCSLQTGNLIQIASQTIVEALCE